MRFKLDSEWEANGVHRHYEQSRAMVGTRAPIDWIVVTKKNRFTFRIQSITENFTIDSKRNWKLHPRCTTSINTSKMRRRKKLESNQHWASSGHGQSRAALIHLLSMSIIAEIGPIWVCSTPSYVASTDAASTLDWPPIKSSVLHPLHPLYV